MTRSLTRRRSDGRPFARPPEIAAAVVVADGLSRAEMLRRATLPRVDPDWFPPEVVVYLIRNARRAGDKDLSGRLVSLLLERCADALVRGVAASVPHADEVRRAILDELTDLFVDDVAPNGVVRDDLDFYEVRFNAALKMTRLMAIRRFKLRARRERQLPEGDAGESTAAERAVSVQMERSLRDMALGSLPDDQRVALNDALETLPDDLCKTVKLVYVDGLSTGSEDPNEKTAATELRITRAAVEKRLKKALAMLKKKMEGDHG